MSYYDFYFEDSFLSLPSSNIAEGNRVKLYDKIARYPQVFPPFEFRTAYSVETMGSKISGLLGL